MKSHILIAATAIFVASCATRDITPDSAAADAKRAE